MIIILEGIDKQGKSTLARKLVKKFKAEYKHFSKPKKNAYKEYSEFVDQIDPKKNYVVDRFFHGELAYGPVMRGKSQVSFDQMRELEFRLCAVGKVVPIYCFTDVNNTMCNFKKCEELNTSVNQIIDLKEGFEDLIADSSYLHWIWFDYRKETDKSIFEKIKNL